MLSGKRKEKDYAIELNARTKKYYDKIYEETEEKMAIVFVTDLSKEIRKKDLKKKNKSQLAHHSSLFRAHRVHHRLIFQIYAVNIINRTLRRLQYCKVLLHYQFV